MYDTDFEYLEHYHIHGGTYELPVEIVTELEGQIEDLVGEVTNIKQSLSDLSSDIDRQISFCTSEAEGTVNGEHCWMAVNYLKKVKGVIDKLR